MSRDALRQALEQIADPIKWEQEHLREGYDIDYPMLMHMVSDPEHYKRIARAALAAPAAPALTDEQIVSIRDDHLPSQGEGFDCIAFARAILAANGKASCPYCSQNFREEKP